MKMLKVIVKQPMSQVRAQLSPAIVQVAQRNLYELAQEAGFTGTLQEFIASLKPQWSSTNW